ncbi:hypothetical protein BOH74_17360 [Pseudomonas versuta]|uniref:Uncharacterized protein n=1 Tax=Pseudomonas versuta TaxID=1788301 RepID=A0A853ZS73_9PSED|nr:hypothetical protein BOH74_17360 [Pseudomonas versuta]
MGELAHKWRQGHVRQAQVRPCQVGCLFQHIFQPLQERLPHGPIMLHRVLGITVGVFVAIQTGLEAGVVFFNQRPADPLPPMVRVMLIQRPVHDVQALFDHPAIATHQHWHRAFWRRCQQPGRFGLEADFHNRNRHAAVVQCHARPHGIGAAAEGIEQGHLTSTVLRPLP